MEPTSPTTSRAITHFLNASFLFGSIVLLLLVIFAAINPPKADISPERVNSYPEYLITIGLIAVFSLSLISLSLLGVVATCISNSFLLSVHIIGQLALICAQFVAIAFTLTVRTRLHYRIEESWRGKSSCPSVGYCIPLERFKRSEMILIISFCCVFLLQVALLISSSILCERISYKERYEAQLIKEKEDGYND